MNEYRFRIGQQHYWKTVYYITALLLYYTRVVRNVSIIADGKRAFFLFLRFFLFRRVQFFFFSKIIQRHYVYRDPRNRRVNGELRDYTLYDFSL